MTPEEKAIEAASGGVYVTCDLIEYGYLSGRLLKPQTFALIYSEILDRLRENPRDNSATLILRGIDRYLDEEKLTP